MNIFHPWIVEVVTETTFVSVGWISISLMDTNDDYLSNEFHHVDA